MVWPPEGKKFEDKICERARRRARRIHCTFFALRIALRGKIAFLPISRFISKRIQDRTIVTVERR